MYKQMDIKTKINHS